MIDSLVKHLPIAKEKRFFNKFGVKEKRYWLLTLHRPSNVDNRDKFDIYLPNSCPRET